MEDKLQLEYAVSKDLNGVVDGRLLATELMADAFRMLIPYAHRCQNCALVLFEAISNQAIKIIQREFEKGEPQSTQGLVMVLGMTDGTQEKSRCRLQETPRANPERN